MTENTEDAEPEVRAPDGPDGGDDAESARGQAEHDVPDVCDAAQPSFLAEVNDAEGGGKEDDSQANPDSAHSGSPGEHTETPTLADGPDETPPEGDALSSGLSAQEHAEEPAYERLTCQVRMYQTPETCYLLPPEATEAHRLPIRIGPEHDIDISTASTLRLITGSANAEEHAASADQITSRATRLMSDCVAWVEIDDNGRKSVVQVRVLRCADGRQPFAYPWLGLTWATYRRMTNGLCLTTPPTNLPPELRPANQHRLDEIARLIREQDAEEASHAAAGSTGAADENADAATDALNVAAEATAAAPGAAEEYAEAATAALDVAAEATAAAPGAADENADAVTAALDVAAEATRDALSTAAEGADVSAKTADIAAAARDTAAENADTTGAAPKAAAKVAGTIADSADTETHAADEETNITNQEMDFIIEGTPIPEAAKRAMEPSSGAPRAYSTRSPPGELILEGGGEESGEDVNEEAFLYGLREAGLYKEDSFQNVLMSASQKKKYTQTRIAAKKHADDFLKAKETFVQATSPRSKRHSGQDDNSTFIV
eukprot:6207684-Pleurochrysis_carterae.AAC.1